MVVPIIINQMGEYWYRLHTEIGFAKKKKTITANTVKTLFTKVKSVIGGFIANLLIGDDYGYKSLQLVAAA